MTDRPVLFSAAMIRALLAGTKTQTRRLLTSGNTYFNGRPWTKDLKAASWDWDRAWVDQGPSPAGNPGPYLKLPYVGDGELAGTVHRIYPKVQPSDRLWVREAWRAHWEEDEIPPRRLMQGDRVHYEADGPPTKGSRFGKLRPSMFMPRWASRLTLIVTGVKVERLQDISEKDAIAEGVESIEAERFEDFDWTVCPKCGGTRLHGALGPNLGYMEVDCVDCDTHRKRYQHLWNHINGPGSWDDNPWVVALTFTVHKQNIDTMKEAA